MGALSMTMTWRKNFKHVIRVTNEDEHRRIMQLILPNKQKNSEEEASIQRAVDAFRRALDKPDV